MSGYYKKWRNEFKTVIWLEIDVILLSQNPFNACPRDDAVQQDEFFNAAFMMKIDNTTIPSMLQELCLSV